MIRSLLVILGVVCAATLLSEAMGLGMLWYRGQLTAETWKDLQLVLSGENRDAGASVSEESDTIQPNSNDFVRLRTGRIFDVARRENELDSLRELVDGQATALTARQKQLEQMKRAFVTQLQTLKKKTESEAVERSRGVVLAMETASAVKLLAQLTVDEDIVLLQGLPEKSIATILQEFAGGEKELQDRGIEIFNALNRGEPERKLISAAGDRLNGSRQPITK